MGFIRLTADGKRIPNQYTSQDIKPVYLLQPNGAPAIEEPAYEGYGVFGGQNAFAWLAKQNIDTNLSTQYSDKHLRNIGISMFDGIPHFMDNEKNVYAKECHAEVLSICGYFDSIVIFKHDAARFEVEGVSSNIGKHVAEGRLVRQEPIVQTYPLKLSFNKDADYNKQEPSVYL